MRKFFWGLVFIVIGLWILLSNYGIVLFNFSRDWPILLIVLGIVEITDAITWQTKRAGTKNKRNKDNIKKLLDDLKEGKIDIEEAEKKIKGVSNG